MLSLDFRKNPKFLFRSFATSTECYSQPCYISLNPLGTGLILCSMRTGQITGKRRREQVEYCWREPVNLALQFPEEGSKSGRALPISTQAQVKMTRREIGQKVSGRMIRTRPLAQP